MLVPKNTSDFIREPLDEHADGSVMVIAKGSVILITTSLLQIFSCQDIDT